jgi:hypothetical protein
MNRILRNGHWFFFHRQSTVDKSRSSAATLGYKIFFLYLPLISRVGTQLVLLESDYEVWHLSD